MGKVKQLLPQAAPSLCQDATENLRGEREDVSGETSQDGVVIAVSEVAARTLKYFKPLWNGGFCFFSHFLGENRVSLEVQVLAWDLDELRPGFCLASDSLG